ncbi:hypothetical protein [Streptosporangium sp. NPDC000396]|uniref:hypothetical protein n=1 Tax=Streptosporangium sp. NPDC000396 TaxID=3366185 RepID=UPI00367956AB
MHSPPAEIRRFFLHAGHFQFYLQDVETYGRAIEDGDADGDPWTEESAQLVRIGVETSSIAVGTARQDWILMMLRVHESPPLAELLDEADHVVEADLDLPTGRLSVYGCDQELGTEEVIALPPGTYRVRISYLPTTYVHPDTNDAEQGDHFEYRVEMWATEEVADIHILKQGPDPWSG